MESLGIYSSLNTCSNSSENRCPFCGSRVSVCTTNQLSDNVDILWDASAYCYTCNKKISITLRNNIVEEIKITLGDRYAN